MLYSPSLAWRHAQESSTLRGYVDTKESGVEDSSEIIEGLMAISDVLVHGPVDIFYWVIRIIVRFHV